MRDLIERRDFGNHAGLTRKGGAGGQNGKRMLAASGGFVSGTVGSNIAMPSPSTVALFDDFLGDVLQDPWNVVEGADTDGTQVVLTGGVGGVLQLTSGNDDANGTQATDASGVTSFLNWQASNGGLAMEARVKLSRITLAYMFVGFTDVISAELPVISAASADTITTNASDGVGVMFDTNMTTDTLWFVGVKGDADATKQNLAVAPVADDYMTIRIEVDAGGGAMVYINGVQFGAYLANAVTPATNLTPCIYCSNADGTSVVTLDVDYIHVAMSRAVDGGAE
jgi:hypothetical protein